MWNAYELDLVNYQNKCRLIRGWDDLFNKVKEHINSVSAMKLSPYYKVMSYTPPSCLRVCLKTIPAHERSRRVPSDCMSILYMDVHLNSRNDIL